MVFEPARIVPPKRRMERAELLGGHSHVTASGTSVHISKRNGKYLARGRLEGRAFGETLGADQKTAERRLHELLVELENGSYQRPSESRRRLLRSTAVPKLSLRQLSGRYVDEIRKLRGKRPPSTTGAACFRLSSSLKVSRRDDIGPWQLT